MISAILTIAVWFIILELHSNKQEEVKASPLVHVLTEARRRYVEAYRLDPTVGDMGSVFDEVIRRSRFVDGTFKFTDDRTFKNVLCDAYSKSCYGHISKAEALFVYDFVMEGYRETLSVMDRLNFDCNLNDLKECI